MAEPRRSRRPIQDSRFSRPVFEETITIHSSHAQRILDRGYYRVAAALYAIDVVLRIIGDHDEMDAVEGLVDAHIQTFATAMEDENKRLMCVFHAKVDTDSTANWTPSPAQTGQ